MTPNSAFMGTSISSYAFGRRVGRLSAQDILLIWPLITWRTERQRTSVQGLLHTGLSSLLHEIQKIIPASDSRRRPVRPSACMASTSGRDMTSARGSRSNASK